MSPAPTQEDDMSQAALNLDFDVGAYPFRKTGGHFSGICASPFDSLMEITERPQIVFVEGRGSWLTDHAGKRYLDFVQGWAVNCLGHCPRGGGRARPAVPRPHHAVPRSTTRPMTRLADLHRASERTAQRPSSPIRGPRRSRARSSSRASGGSRTAAAPTRSSPWIPRFPRPHARRHGGLRKAAVGAIVRAEGAGI